MASLNDAISAATPEGWNDRDWEALLYAIKNKSCTPFLGAGACHGVLPTGKEIAREWADEYDYPFSDRDNLVRVAQFVALEAGPMTPKFKMLDRLRGKGPPNFADLSEPHRAVADLNLPVYITTNYDDFMVRALQRDSPPRAPQREVCNWNSARRRRPREVVAALEPTVEKPLVFHLHGTLDDLQSMVLTEDDYLDFLMYTSEDDQFIPPRIQEAFSSSLLFIGYSLEDMNFKVLFRKLATYMQRSEGARHVSVQLAPLPGESTEEQIARASRQKKYLERHFDLQKVKVFWGTASDFARDLHDRWQRFNRG
jgi:hypothetical protein